MGLDLLLSSITPVRTLPFFNTHSLRRRLRVITRLLILIIRPIQTFIASRAILALRHQARDQLRHTRILDHQVLSCDLCLALLQILLLESASRTIMPQHAANLLSGLPLQVPVLLPALHAVATAIGLRRLAGPDHLPVLLLGALAAALVLRTPLLTYLCSLPSRQVMLLSGIVRLGDLRIDRLRQISALGDFRLHCGVELAALETNLLIRGVLASKVPLQGCHGRLG
mmetsp:Transcript_34744/g.76093  ORF Transcript_34744/g.76093 Transcript_34744/m.76093 type:complete len:227 (-) Transcript_34744:618-1298(-)